MVSNRFRWFSTVFLMTFAFWAHGLPGESIVLDPTTGNYTITYYGYDKETDERTVLRTAIFEPATKINPAVRSAIKIGKNGVVSYRYLIQNGATSRQSVVMIIFDPIASLVTTDAAIQPEQGYSNTIAHNWGVASYPMYAPEGWNGWATASRNGGIRAGWDSIDASLPPGVARNGFGFFSTDLPGINFVQIRGNSAIRKFVDEGPEGEVGDQPDELVQNNYISRPAAIPVIAVPTPFDAAILLDRIRTEMQTWPGKQLLDAAYSAKLDGYLSSAANAFRMNQLKVAREQIEAVRKLLSKEHHNVDHDDEDDEDTEEHKRATRFTIDRLAARVLDFDLRYVLKRTEREHEERDKHEQKKR